MSDGSVVHVLVQVHVVFICFAASMLAMQVLLFLLPVQGAVTMGMMHSAGPGEVEGHSGGQVEGATDCCQEGEPGPAEQAAGDFPFCKASCPVFDDHFYYYTLHALCTSCITLGNDWLTSLWWQQQASEDQNLVKMCIGSFCFISCPLYLPYVVQAKAT